MEALDSAAEAVFRMGHYRDTFRREPGGWRLAAGRAPRNQRLSHQRLRHICRPPVTSSTVPVM
jgi:hypothetical protein